MPAPALPQATGTELFDAEMTALEQARNTLVARLMANYPPMAARESPQEWAEQKTAREQALMTQVRDMGIARVLQFHQLLDYGAADD